MICFPLDNTPCEAKDMGIYLATRTRGVFSSDGNLAVTPGESGLSVSVSPGLAWLKWSDFWGVAALQAQALTLDLDTADGALKRIDAIVCRLDKVNNRAEIVVKKGAPSSAPIVVPPVRDANYDELYIATVLIGAGVISISASAITDQRLNEEYCGLMRDGVTGIPTASLHAQAQQILTELTDALNAQIVRQSAEFDAWFDDLKGKLGEDPATALQQQVDNLNAAVVGDSFKLKGDPISIEAAGANRIDSLILYGENAQGGTTEAPMALTGVENVFVGGNNLLPKAMETKTVYGVTFTPNPNGSISVSGTATDNSSYNFADGLDRVLLGRTVCVSGGSKQTQVIINEKTASGTFKRNVIINAKTPTAVGVLSKQADDNTLYATIYVPTGTTVNTTIYPMLNLGNTAMPYEPYQGSVTQLPIPLPLHEVGDVRDVCRTRVKSVYDKRVVLDGSSDEVFIQTNIIDGWIQIATESDAVIPESTSIVGSIKSSYLKAYAIEEVYSKKYSGISVDSNRRIRLSFKTSEYPDVTSVETARTYLSAHPLTVYYQSTAYDGTNGLDVCLTEYQTVFAELDGTESQFTYAATETKGLVVGLADDLEIGFLMLCSHGVYSSTGTESIRVWRLSSGKVGIYLPESLVTPYGYDGTVTTVKSAAAGYFAAQKEAGTPVQIAYQLATPEVYATDPVDFDNAAGPLIVMTGGELEAAFKSADKVVESRIDFVEDTLNEQGQAIAEKAPISHSSDKSTYGLGSGSQFGHVKLSDATTSGSNANQGVAATPSAVNQVHAKANAAQSTANAAMPKAGGTFTGTVAAKTENIAGAYIRNISVQNSASQLQYTNFIIMVRK